MIIGYHLVFGAYGFWLPNDPRGSGSDSVWARDLQPFGKATKVATRHSRAEDPHDWRSRVGAKEHLKYPVVRFSGVQARAVARGIADIARKVEFVLFACAVMPDHVHVVMKRHRRSTTEAIEYLKRAGTRQLNKEELHPFAGQIEKNSRPKSPWCEGGWSVFLNSPNEIRQRIRYVEENPIKANLPRQQWGFVEDYEE